jgi:eukaryotic-like serine/threonine-protein kinase
MDMNKPSIDDLLEQLEEAREAGRPIDIEKLCAAWPDLLQPLKDRWERLLRFEERFGDKSSEQLSDATRRESTAEVQSKIADMVDKLDGARVIMQTEIFLEKFHDRGGLGEVYRAQDGDLAREVAVKLLRVDRKGDSNREDFHRESRIIGGMNHPGIVAIHGVGETIDGRPFYTMPFLDGGTLRQKASQFHRQNLAGAIDDLKEFRDLLYRLVAVCKTIAYAHSRGIVHRDLKAENILLGKYGETLVIDWGCASKVDRDERFKVYGERTLQLKGVDGVNSSSGLTLRYASPEQLHGGREVGPESDIYSLGAILYLLLTGKSPLEQEPDEKVRSLVMKGQVPPPDSIKPRTSRTLSAICQKAMSVEPHDRYATALQMSDDIERYLADSPTSVCKLSWGTRMARIVRRNRTASLILLGTLLVGTSLLTLALAGQSVLARRAEASAAHRLRMAAALVSNVGGFEIERRISLLEIEASKKQLLEAMAKIDASYDTKATPKDNKVAAPDEKEAAPDDADAALDDKEIREELQTMLYVFRDELDAAGIKLDSLFINDSKGIQVARVRQEDSIGKNFAYRQYFHGGDKDLDPESDEYKKSPPKVSSQSLVSTAYVSTNKAQGDVPSIKTALSVPIKSQEKVLGRLSMSLQIQELKIFDSLKELPLRAVLFETRDYPLGQKSAEGLILDRFNSESDEKSDDKDDNGDEKPNTEMALEDSLPRLETKTLGKVEKVQGTKVELIPDFFDPAIGRTKAATACAELRIPYRNDIKTGWKVLFIEAE